MSIESAFTQFPNLITQRLELRQIRPTDAQALFNIFSHRDVVEFGSTPLFTSLDDAEYYMQRGQTGYELQQSIRWGVALQDDTVIGTCGFHHFGPGYHCVETGYNLHRDYWGQGLIREAMSAVLKYGFMTLGFHRIEAVIAHNNVRSRNVAAKLGFTYEGTLRQRYFVRDRFEDESYYSLLRPEWMEKQQRQGFTSA